MTESGTRGRVLVVDDKLANRELLRQELEDNDFTVETAASGEECLAIAQRFLPEVILMDIQMPGLDGIETCKRLKKLGDLQHTPVVFVTANRADDQSAVDALAAGGNDFLSKPYSPPVLLARVSSQVAISRAHSQLRRMAMTDELTGLFSRRYLFDSLRRAVKSVSRQGPPCVGCLVVDVDQFKLVNDRLGHLEGDAILKKVASAILHASRETDIVGRFGGEEFVVVMPHTDLPGAVSAAERVRGSVETQCTPVTVSVGATAVCAAEMRKPEEVGNIDALIRQLLKQADSALYAATQNGRNCVVSQAS